MLTLSQAFIEGIASKALLNRWSYKVTEDGVSWRWLDVVRQRRKDSWFAPSVLLAFLLFQFVIKAPLWMTILVTASGVGLLMLSFFSGPTRRFIQSCEKLCSLFPSFDIGSKRQQEFWNFAGERLTLLAREKMLCFKSGDIKGAEERQALMKQVYDAFARFQSVEKSYGPYFEKAIAELEAEGVTVGVEVRGGRRVISTGYIDPAWF